MSDQNPPPPPGGQHPQQPYPGQPYLPPQKKRGKALWIVLGVVIAVIVVCCGGGGILIANSGGDSVKASKGGTGSNSGQQSGDIGTQEHPAPRGTAVQNKSDKYQIDNVQIRDDLGSFADKPQGKYVVITLTVENVKNSTVQISSDDFTLLVNGTQIDTSDQGFALDDGFSYDDLSPHLKRTGKIVFDVDPKYAGQGVLRAQAELSADEAVYLSLKK